MIWLFFVHLSLKLFYIYLVSCISTLGYWYFFLNLGLSPIVKHWDRLCKSKYALFELLKKDEEVHFNLYLRLVLFVWKQIWYNKISFEKFVMLSLDFSAKCNIRITRILYVLHVIILMYSILYVEKNVVLNIYGIDHQVSIRHVAVIIIL